MLIWTYGWLAQSNDNIMIVDYSLWNGYIFHEKFDYTNSVCDMHKYYYNN